MKKGTYYLFKVMLPDFLLSIMMILLFDALNYKTEITNSLYLLYYAGLFTLFDIIITERIDTAQVKLLRKMSLTQILYEKKDSIFFVFPLFKIIGFLISIGLFFVTFLIFKESIIFEKGYICLLLGLIIEILKIILNKLINFDKILVGASQKQIDKHVEKMFEDIMENQNIEEAKDEKEKEEKITKGLEEFLKKIAEEENLKKEQKEENNRKE